MSRIVLDASAILGLLGKEPGADKLTPEMLNTAVSSTVNLAEVQAKLVMCGIDPNDAWEATLASIREPVDFTAEHARIAGTLVSQTRSLGLSLGAGPAWPSQSALKRQFIQQINPGRT